MDQQSVLQQQYPLSPRKFLKKMLEKTFVWMVFLFFVALIVYFIFSIDSSMSSTSQPNPLSSIVIALLITFICMALYGWYVKVYIRRYFYDVTDNYVTIKKGVFAPAEIHVQYSKVQDVYVDQDILDRIMGLYDVHLASATVTSGIEAHIDGVEKAAADGLKDLLLQKLQGGGSGTPASPGVASNISAASQSQSSEPVTFGKEISSRTYPIGGLWFVQQMIAWFFTSIFYAVLFGLYFWDEFSKSVNPGMIWIICFGIFVVTYILHLIYALLWRVTFSFEFLPDYVMTRKGVIAKNEGHLPYRAIQDVSVSQGIVERMLGLATVRIENAAAMQVQGRRFVSSAVLIPGQPLSRANEISDAIRSVLLTKNATQTGL